MFPRIIVKSIQAWVLVWFCAANLAAAKPRQQGPIANIFLGAYIGHAQNRSLGLFEVLSRNEFVTTNPDFFDASSIDFWQASTGKIGQRIMPPESVHPYSLQISSDARRLTGIPSSVTNVGHEQKLFVWSVHTKKLLREIGFGHGIFLEEVAFWPGKPEQAIALLSSGSERSNRIIHVDLNTGKFGKHAFAAAKYLFHGLFGYVVLSPDDQTVARVYEMGEGFPGSIDIVNMRSGKVLAHYEANWDSPPVFGAAFFLSNHRFFFGSWPVIDPVNPVYGGYSFAFPAKKVKLRGDSNLRCIAGWPSRLGYGFFESGHGLELWNIARHRRIKRWPQLLDVAQIAFSRHQNIAAFYYEKAQPEDNFDYKQPFKVSVQMWNLDSARRRRAR